MTALTAPRHDQRQTGEYIDVDRDTTTTIYHGGAVTAHTTGLARAGVASRPFLGVAAETVDSRNAQTYVRVWAEGVFSFAGSGFAQTDVGTQVKLSDDQTVTKVAGSGTEYPIGTITKFVSATEVLVKIAVGQKTVAA